MIKKIKIDEHDVCVCFDMKQTRDTEHTLFGDISETRYSFNLKETLVPAYMIKDEYLDQIKLKLMEGAND